MLAQEEERKRISRELHDGTGQGLMVLRLYLGMLAGDQASVESQTKVQEALRLLDHTIEELRRIIGRLSPRSLEELGLVAAIRKEARNLSRNTRLKARLDLPRELALDHESEIALYRSLQEALHNIAKHARARSFVIRIEQANGRVRLSVEDDGIGVSAKSRPGARGFGLTGMRERIAALGGKVQWRSRRAGGTRLVVELPESTMPARMSGSEAGHELAHFELGTSGERGQGPAAAR
jgi:signal transduction histidine kinase